MTMMLVMLTTLVMVMVLIMLTVNVLTVNVLTVYVLTVCVLTVCVCVQNLREGLVGGLTRRRLVGSRNSGSEVAESAIGVLWGTYT